MPDPLARPDVEAPIALRADAEGPPMPPKRKHPNRVIIFGMVACDLTAGTAYVVGYFVDLDFMLVLGVLHLGMGALHYVEARDD